MAKHGAAPDGNSAAGELGRYKAASSQLSVGGLREMSTSLARLSLNVNAIVYAGISTMPYKRSHLY